MEKLVIYPLILTLLGQQARAMVNWEMQDPKVARLAREFKANRQMNQVDHQPLGIHQPTPGDIIPLPLLTELKVTQNLSSFEDPDFGFFNFIFDGDNEEPEPETEEGGAKFAETNYLTEIFAPIGNPGDPPKKKEQSNNIFTDMAELVPDQNANFMFEQPQSKNALLRAVHGFLANNSIGGMDMEHKGITEVDFSNAQFSGDVQLPGSEAFDLQHEDLFKLMTEHVTQKNAILEAHLEAERAAKFVEEQDIQEEEEQFNFKDWQKNYQVKGLEQELEQKTPKKKEKQPEIRFKPLSF